MFTISRATAYALQSLVQMSYDPKLPPISCSRLSRLGRMPDRFLLQILRQLVTKGLCASTPQFGVFGGYRLAKPLKQITLYDVVCAVDGEPRIGLGIEPSKMFEGSAIDEALLEITTAIRDALSAVNVALLVVKIPAE